MPLSPSSVWLGRESENDGGGGVRYLYGSDCVSLTEPSVCRYSTMYGRIGERIPS